MRSPGLADALQRVLAGEHAAVWALGTLGAATSMSATPALFTQVSEAWEGHRDRRDRLAELVRDLGEDPVGSQAAYAVPEPLATPDDVRRAAARVELVSAEAWSFLVASSTGGTRRWATRVLTELAVSAVLLGAGPSPLPGAGDLLG